MAFNRPPRIQYKVPEKKIVIPAPKNVPSKPGETNWLMTVLPLAALLLVAIFMLFGSASMGLSYLLFLPLMLVTYLANFFNTKIQQRKYTEDLAKAKKNYMADLHNVETELQHIQTETIKIYLRNNPAPSKCTRIVKKRASRLGERRVEDPDFLRIRLGTGTVSAPYEIEQPDASVRVDELEDEFRFADQLYKSYSIIPDAPILTDLPKRGSLGIAGKRSIALDVARAMLIQIATHHWFTEVNVAVICKPQNFSDWKWAQNLPHYAKNLRWGEIHATSQQVPPRSLMVRLEEELQRREQFVETAKLAKEKDGANISPPLPHLVIVFDNLDINYSHPALILLQKKGRELGVYGIFLSEHARQIPGECGAILNLQANGRYMETGPEGNVFDCYCIDRLGLKQAEETALSLAKIKWIDHQDTSQPPEIVGFLEIFHAKKVEDLPIDKWWDGSPPMGYLRIPLGRISETTNLILNLNDEDGAHGPHGLIGGMTGSGKSELLKTLILSLAVTHHPYDLNFALIDYKGGAAFNDLAGITQHGEDDDNIPRLPHIVGVVTDIENNATYAERVIQSLTGEIERRKRLLNEAQSSFDLERPHIDAYNKGLSVKRPFPHLIIIFDEFAEFKQRHPEESKRLISIARQGRSLGVHLILATQNIPAAVDPEILQNSSFRICLKVSEPQDSIQMVGIPDAVTLNRGRAYFSSGIRVQFQSAYTGKKYLPDKDRSHLPEITYIKDGGTKEKRIIASLLPKSVLPNSEARALVRYLDQRAKELRLLPPPPVWPDPLPEKIYLEDILFDPQTGYVRGGWDKQPDWLPCEIYEHTLPQTEFIPPVLGLVDKPLQQKQEVLVLDPSKGWGNLLLLGTAGSGKSTLMQTLVVSLARTNTPEQVHVYILDFGGDSALKALETFPHVGAVVTRLESERAERLIQYIDNEITNRIHLLRESQVDTWLQYNQHPKSLNRLPAIYLLIDNFREFRSAFQERTDLLNKIASFISGGQATGIYLAITSNLLEDVPESLSGTISARWTLHQARHENYYAIVGQPSEAKKQEEAIRGMIPGRGLLRSTHPLEFQIALPIKEPLDVSGTQQDRRTGTIENLTLLAQQMNEKWKGPRPQPIKTLPTFITLPRLQRSTHPAGSNFWVMLGIDFETLKPIGLSLDDSSAFLVADNSNGSGKTALMHTWAIGLMESYSEKEIHLHLIDFHTRTLRGLRNGSHVYNYINAKSTLTRFLNDLSKEVQKRQEVFEEFFEKNPDVIDASVALRDRPREVVIIDDYHRLSAYVDDNVKRTFADSLVRGDELGIHFLISGNAAELASDFSDPFLKQIKKMGTGVLLGGSDGIDLFNAQRPPGRATTGLNPGRGYIIRRGKARLFQAAVIWERGEILQKALKRRIGS